MMLGDHNISSFFQHKHVRYNKLDNDVGVKSTPSSRMLKKARSFRDDLKTKIIRRTPSLPRSTSPSSVRKSPRQKRRGIQRGGSFHEGTKTDKLVQKEDDIEKLENESKKVYQSLTYVLGVVDKNMLELLPGSATVVLETVMEVNLLLSNYFIDQESSAMSSITNQVYQCVAKLIRWADSILLHGNQALEKEYAHEVIQAVQDGIQELVELSIEKLRKRSLSPYQTLPPKPKENRPISVCSEGGHRSSLPDIPLTKREQEILRETNRLSGFNNNISRSSDDILDGPPPPKPPLPPNWESPLDKRSGMHQEESERPINAIEEVAPPLPPKQRTKLDSVSSQSDSTTPTNQSPLDQPSSDGSNLLNVRSQEGASTSPILTTPLSQSPTSSVSSALSASSEDVLTSPPPTTANVRYSHYDNLALHPLQNHQINDLTRKINELTSGVYDPKKANGLKGDHHHEKSDNQNGTSEEVPPVLPEKTIVRRSLDRTERSRVVHSHYDNVSSSASEFVFMRTSRSQGFNSANFQTSAKQQALYSKGTQVTLSQETFSSSETFSSTGTYSSSMESLQKPPPIPPKKKHVHDYMQMLGQYTPMSTDIHARHSINSINYYQTQWYQHQMEFFPPMYPRSKTISIMSNISSGANSDVFSITSSSSMEDNQVAPLPASSSDSSSSSSSSSATPPQLPPKRKSATGSMCSARSSQSDIIPEVTMETKVEEKPQPDFDELDGSHPLQCMEELPASARISSGSSSTQHSSPPPEIQKDGDSDFAELSTLDDVDVSDQLTRKKKSEEGPDIRGGSVDALIVHATTAGKADFMYQEAFLCTYRTFITPRELVQKLLYRYNRFSKLNVVKKQKLSRNAFSLLIRVVDELCTEVDEDVLQTLMDLEFQLLCDGELMLAKILRKKVLEKSAQRRVMQAASQNVKLLPSYQLTAKQHHLTDFKSEHIAEQMTLLDAELFQKIEIPEVLLWAKEQCEEHSPNLNRFSEHFNKMSYWCRTRILEQDDARERERYLIKFIKVMRYLRKFNNFNSYLAVLSALNSAPIRRLDWQKQNLETLKDFCELIDSSSSFRAYRQALGDTEPPCIPYIGMILQDLTFVHIGNQDFLNDGHVNFAKRWQQFNILDNMRRFRKCNYEFKKHHKIMAYFNNFDNYLCEESLWQISESIKPRGGRRKVMQPS